MSYFDWHSWDPVFCRTQEEINAALVSLGIKGKTIDEVHVIGAARNMVPWRYTQIVDDAIVDAEMSCEEMESEEYPVDFALVPYEVEICEPVVILFTDGTTFELMPREPEGMLMSVNQIPPETLDGTNHHNFDSKTFFRCLHGRSISDIETIRCRTTVTSGTSSYREERKVIFHFSMERSSQEGNYGFFVCRQYQSEGWFTFGIMRQNYGFGGVRNEIASVPFSMVEAVAYDLHQIIIIEGHDSGEYFSIMPVKLSSLSRYNTKEYQKEEISIEEGYVSAFLYYFLDKYFDESLPYGENGEGQGKFEWYLVDNLYSYETITRMLQDIEKCADLLEHDYENPYLSGLKERYKWYDFVPHEEIWNKKPSDREAGTIIRDNIHFVTDFYRRFVRRMKAMMDNTPDYDLITFIGP